MTERQSDEFDRDLHPSEGAGQNHGQRSDDIAREALTAYDIKDAHRRLSQLTDENLRSIPILPTGTRLAQGAVYIDLRANPPEEFTARGDMAAGEGNWYVPKSQVDYQLWNELIGVDDAPRLGEADEA